MKLSLGLAVVLSLSSVVIVRAEPAPVPIDTPTETGDEAAPAEPDAQDPQDSQDPPQRPVAPRAAPQEAPVKHRARMSNPSPRSIRHERIHDDGESRLDKKEDTIAGGRHWRIRTSEGAVHVWIPPGYDRETAGTVVYVHGYWIDADGAWSNYNLAQQFKASRQNALFIVPDAPQNNDDNVKWPALKDLRRAVSRANIHLPDGPVIVMGHSGAFRTIMQWVDHRLVEQIILLDAMYAGESAFDEYIGKGKRADEHKLIVVGANTAANSQQFVDKYKFAVARERMPDGVSGFSRRERNAKLLYIRSQYEHMSIVTSGKVIPTLLRVTPLKAL